jgi:hypothetical protein
MLFDLPDDDVLYAALMAGLAAAGISRLSYGPYPYIGLMETLKQQARALY